MEAYICLLRGINVSGKNMIKMPDLVRSIESAGFSEVQAYIQSGNIIFCYKPESCQVLATRIEKNIFSDFGLTIPTLVVTHEDLSVIIRDNPFIKRPDIDPDKLHVTFLAGEPGNVLVEKLLSYSYPPDQILYTGKAVYLNCPEGYGRTKYNNTFIEKKLAVQATTRNWRTCLKLLEMSGL
jgi:uncharacterized protein (DUF1697 family)